MAAKDWFDWWLRVPPASFPRRLGLAALAGFGTALAVSQSWFYVNYAPIPYKWIPDVRLPFVFTVIALSALWGCWGGGGRRVTLIVLVLLFVGASSIDMMMVHWVAGLEGTLSGDRVGVVRVIGTTLALASALLINADTNAVDLRWALLLRGAPERDADQAHALLWRAALRRVGTLAVGVMALALLLWLAEQLWGDAKWGSTTAAVGAGLALLGLGTYVVLRGLRAED